MMYIATRHTQLQRIIYIATRTKQLIMTYINKLIRVCDVHIAIHHQFQASVAYIIDFRI